MESVKVNWIRVIELLLLILLTIVQGYTSEVVKNTNEVVQKTQMNINTLKQEVTPSCPL